MVKKFENNIFLLIFIIYLLLNYFLSSLGIVIGDSKSYLSGGTYTLNQFDFVDLLKNPSILMHFIGNNLFNLFNQSFFLVNLFVIILLVLSFFFYYKKINNNYSKLIFLFLLIIPSISINSLWFSKESFIFVCLLISLIRFKKFLNFKIFIDPIFIFSLLLIFIMKQLFFVSIIGVYFFLLIEIKFHRKIEEKILIYLFFILFFLFLFFFISQYVDQIIIDSDKHFNPIANTNREDFFVLNYDFIKKSIYGIYLFFLGPRFNEIASINLIIVYTDKIMTMTLISLIIIYAYNNLYLNNFLYYIFLMLTIFIILTFIHYPQSVQNIGSGFRYKSVSLFAFTIFSLFIIQLVKERLK